MGFRLYGSLFLELSQLNFLQKTLVFNSMMGNR